MNQATSFSHRVFEQSKQPHETVEVQQAQDILDALEAKGVKRAELAKALGVSQPNATKLYKPDARTGKKRTLGYDEGQMLIRHFALDGEAEPDSPTVSAGRLAPLLEAIVPLVPKAGLTERSATILAEALSYGLGLLEGDAPTPGELRVAARGAVARFRDLLLQ